MRSYFIYNMNYFNHLTRNRIQNVGNFVGRKVGSFELFQFGAIHMIRAQSALLRSWLHHTPSEYVGPRFRP